MKAKIPLIIISKSIPEDRENLISCIPMVDPHYSYISYLGVHQLVKIYNPEGVLVALLWSFANMRGQHTHSQLR